MNLRVIRVAKWCLISVFMLIILGFVAGVGLFVYYAKDAPKLEESKLESKPSSVIYDKDGQVLVDLGIEKRELADTKDIPLELVDAVTSIEDHRFSSTVVLTRFGLFHLLFITRKMITRKVVLP
jgi:penicillin-binding protein 1A